jgi:hypothetical protein
VTAAAAGQQACRPQLNLPQLLLLSMAGWLELPCQLLVLSGLDSQQLFS